MRMAPDRGSHVAGGEAGVDSNSSAVRLSRPLAIVDVVSTVHMGNGVDIGNSDRGTVGDDSLTSHTGDDSSVS